MENNESDEIVFGPPEPQKIVIEVLPEFLNDFFVYACVIDSWVKRGDKIPARVLKKWASFIKNDEQIKKQYATIHAPIVANKVYEELKKGIYDFQTTRTIKKNPIFKRPIPPYKKTYSLRDFLDCTIINVMREPIHEKGDVIRYLYEKINRYLPENRPPIKEYGKKVIVGKIALALDHRLTSDRIPTNSEIYSVVDYYTNPRKGGNKKGRK